MFELAYDFVDEVLGLSRDANELSVRQMTCRTLVVFIYAVLLARLGDRRFLGQAAGFDIMVAIVLGSVLSRGINGQAAFFPSLVASGALVALHHLMATWACRSHRFSRFVKGRAHVLVKDGEVDPREMRRCKITQDDLDEQLRLHGGVTMPAEVAEARFERNGDVSVVKAKPGA